MFYGARKTRRLNENLIRIASLPFAVLKFDHENARHAGAIRVTLAAVGTPIGPDDVLIAGQAWARKLIAVTHNTPAFAATDGLRIDGWEV